jgi:hypothetical protein
MKRSFRVSMHFADGDAKAITYCGPQDWSRSMAYSTAYSATDAGLERTEVESMTPSGDWISEVQFPKLAVHA